MMAKKPDLVETLQECNTKPCVERGEKTMEECKEHEARLKKEIRRRKRQLRKLKEKERALERKEIQQEKKLKAQKKQHARLIKRLPTEALISYMVDQGLEVTKKLALEIVDRGDGAVPYLDDIIRTDVYWEKGGPGDAWAPIHAIHILPKIKTEAALKAILHAVRDRHEDLGDWLTEDISSILAHFDEMAVEPIKEIIEDRNRDEFVRSAATRALCAISRKHPEHRRSTVEMLRERIKDPEEDEEFTSLIMDDLAGLKDPDALEDLKSAFPGDLDLIERIYQWDDEKAYFQRDMRDPLEFFSTDNISRLRNINYGGREEKWRRKTTPPTTPPPVEEKPKIGRNDPCPCGSGKKYKKCCLKAGKR